MDTSDGTSSYLLLKVTRIGMVVIFKSSPKMKHKDKTKEERRNERKKEEKNAGRGE